VLGLRKVLLIGVLLLVVISSGCVGESQESIESSSSTTTTTIQIPKLKTTNESLVNRNYYPPKPFLLLLQDKITSRIKLN
jgi:PBP1b-binding outer membrane lipoprotein LpoB